MNDQLIQPRHIAIFMYSLGHGGSQRRTLSLAEGFSQRGHRVDLVVIDADGPLRSALPSGVQLLELKPWLLGRIGIHGRRGLELRFAIPALARYLRQARPTLLLSSASHVNLTSIQAHRLSGVPSALVLRVSNAIGDFSAPDGRKAAPAKLAQMRRLYPRADAIVAVSHSVAKDLDELIEGVRGRIQTVYNPTWHPELLEKAAAPADHPWFAPGAPPVILGAGRLSMQKDFPTLIRAFAQVRKKIAAKLMILGNTKKAHRREALLKLAAQLGIKEDFALPGFVDNPHPYMARSAAFVLPSLWEGLPGVLIEAMASGCPVIATDCPGGSREILEDGRLGALVAVRDPNTLAAAILESLKKPPAPRALRERAEAFNVDSAVGGYLATFETAIARRTGGHG
jgi:glycosyltransferase involved in cell wall biosynthesis